VYRDLPDNTVVLSLVSVATGELTSLGPASRDTAVAFSRDGSRIAFELHQSVQVTDRAGRTLSRFPLPAGNALAGRGAWTPDGTALALVPRDPAYDWAMRYADPVTGAEHAGPALPRITTTTPRADLLGWQPDGTAVVRRGTELLALSPGAVVQRTLLTAPTEVTALTIAGAAIADGLTRHANPPWPFGPRVLIGAAFIAVVLVGADLIRRRYRRHRRWRRVAAISWRAMSGPQP
jgi:hypothetical protein